MNARTLVNCMAMLLCIGVISSCVVPKTIATKCAWCKESIGARNYIWDQIGHNVARLNAAGGVDENLGTAATLAEAERLMKKDADSMAIIYENYYFCSLRCLSAYKASVGVKEQRVRVIPHE